MSSVHLADYIDNAEYELSILIPPALKGELDARGIQLLCDTFRQRGVCSFLLTGDPYPFHLNSMLSAGAYVAYVEAVDNRNKVTSQAKGFYDAVGSGFWECARRIASSSRMEWNSAKEYEEDFLFVLFLMKHFFLSGDRSECQAILARHEEASEGADEAHRNVCLAYLQKDSALFDASVKELLEARAERVEGLVAREAIPEEHWSWLRYFSSEGLALVKLAERAGMETGRDYLHVSERLREGPSFEFDEEAWKVVPRSESDFSA